MGTVLVYTNVYSGPGDSGAYARIGSLFAGDSYTTIWDEFGYEYIEYPVDNGQKLGYINGGSNTVPSAFSNGVLGTMSAPQTVWSKPGNGQISMGSVSSGEQVSVLISNDAGYSYIEYGSASGTKRGWVNRNNVNFDLSTALAKMQTDVDTYASPSAAGQKIGSLSEEEYVIILSENSNWAQVEYCITSSPYRKQAYIPANSYIRINNTTVPSIPSSEDDGYSSIMLGTATVYAGPSSITYYQIGTVYNAETVTVLFSEFDWFCISYSTDNGPKCGYVPKNYISGYSQIENIVPDRTGSIERTGGRDFVINDVIAYTGPGTSYVSSGSLSADEPVTRFNEETNGYVLIEYFTSWGVKRGYIPYTALFSESPESSGTAWGIIGYVNLDSSVSVYYDPNMRYESGAIGVNEYVVILSQTNSSSEIGATYFIEYNTNSGRKRGYVDRSKLHALGPTIGEHRQEMAEANYSLNPQTVYGGPSNMFAEIGSFAAFETVSELYTDGAFSYIEYTAGTQLKRGYVPTDTLIFEDFVITDYSNSILYPQIENVITYGQSGLGRPLRAYQIGTGNNHLILNYSIHGWEDEFNYSGRTIERVGEATLEYLLENHNLIDQYDWTVYIILSSNPDGLLNGNSHYGPGRCTVKRYGTNRNELVDGGVDMNRSFQYKINGSIQFIPVTTDGRYYTGPEPNWCPESEALKNFLDTHLSDAGENVFIDTHGYTAQIISYDNSDKRIYNKFHQYFTADFGSRYNQVNYSVSDGAGYAATYAYSILGMNSCLFEFPKVKTNEALFGAGYDSMYINAIIDIIKEIGL